MEGAGLAVLLLVGDVSGRREIDKMHDRVCCQKKLSLHRASLRQLWAHPVQHHREADRHGRLPRR
eukprot:1626672-Prymnesium_polylepis.1